MIYQMNAAQHDATCRNSSQVVKLEMFPVAVSISLIVMV